MFLSSPQQHETVRSLLHTSATSHPRRFHVHVWNHGLAGPRKVEQRTRLRCGHPGGGLASMTLPRLEPRTRGSQGTGTKDASTLWSSWWWPGIHDASTSASGTTDSQVPRKWNKGRVYAVVILVVVWHPRRFHVRLWNHRLAGPKELERRMHLRCGHPGGGLAECGKDVERF